MIEQKIYIMYGIITILVMGILWVTIIRKKEKKKARQIEKELKESLRILECKKEETEKIKEELKVKSEEWKVSQEKIKKIAYEDKLTSLPNAAAFIEILERTVETLRKEETIAVIYADLDNFKSANDMLGHSYGDELMLDVSHRIRQNLEDGDYLARYNSDEFVILSQNFHGLEKLEEKIKRVQKAFHFPFLVSSREFFLTLSIGVAFGPKDGKTAQALLKNSDAAMYTAKEMGKNTYCYYQEEMTQKLMETIENQARLRQAVKDSEFEVYYQAQMDMMTGKLVGFESLIRWNHPEKGLLLPEQFLSLAEITGLIVPIGQFVLREVCLWTKQWKKEFNSLTVSLNLSGREFKDPDFYLSVRTILEETKAEPKRLKFEITEETALADLEYTKQMINRMEEIGISFVIDNFGTGRSSMDYLKMIPFIELKMDRHFLNSAMESDKDREIVAAMIHLMRSFRLTIVAEGVEEKESAVFLEEAGCEKAQGYYYAMPMAKKEAENLIEKQI